MTEQRKRSIAKGITWRLLATTDTILLALIFTGSAGAAFSIGGIELLTKILWYYLHERAWLRINGPHSHPKLAALFGQDARMRSIAKAVSWRAIGAIDTFLISLIVTGRLGMSGSIGSTELITKISIYYLHERLWRHIPWGLDMDSSPEQKKPSLAKDVIAVIDYYYHLGAAALYALAAFAFVFIFAGIIYALHALW